MDIGAFPMIADLPLDAKMSVVISDFDSKSANNREILDFNSRKS